MSELQISLLALGVFVVLAVYLYGAWQQRRYRNRFGAAFVARRGDVLESGEHAAMAADHGVVEHTLHAAADSIDDPDETCKTLSDETDYIAVLFAASPLHASSLEPLWDRRFDFGKNFLVCGARDAGGWENVLTESQHAYDTFRLSLQLVDRSGAVSEAQLEDFGDTVRDLAEALGAETNLPDAVEAAAAARQLDAFCAEVDNMIGLNILPAGGDLLFGEAVAEVAARMDMPLRADGMFHLVGTDGHTLYTLANFDESPFQEDELEGLPVIGLSLQMDVPRVPHPVHHFEEMLELAYALGDALNASVVDDNRQALDEQGVAKIRAHVAALEKKMQSRQIAPGSTLARRLFS